MHDTVPKRKKLPHAIPPWVPDDAVFFITINTSIRGTNILCVPAIAAAIRESFVHRQRHGIWGTHLLLLMPDHLHALMSFPRPRNIRHTISKWKEYTAKGTGIRWQRDFFDHRLRNNECRIEKAAYIRMNPVRKNLVSVPEDWPYVWNDFN